MTCSGSRQQLANERAGDLSIGAPRSAALAGALLPTRGGRPYQHSCWACSRRSADAHQAASTQIALSWVIRHPNVVAIVGASSADQAAANAEAADLDLNPDEVTALAETASTFGPT